MVVVVGKLVRYRNDVLNNRRMAEHNFFRPDELDAGGRLSLKILFKELGECQPLRTPGRVAHGDVVNARNWLVKRPQGRVYMRFQRLFHVELKRQWRARVRHAIGIHRPRRGGLYAWSQATIRFPAMPFSPAATVVLATPVYAGADGQSRVLSVARNCAICWVCRRLTPISQTSCAVWCNPWRAK